MNLKEKTRELFHINRPVAITMWEFSWIERRWPGAGYEDWDQALCELKSRGYDVVRIDPFPHLLAKDPFREWTLQPVWSVQDWGSQTVNKVNIYDNLHLFLDACKRHGIKVALSSWFRIDTEKTLMEIKTPEDHGKIWVKTLSFIQEWGLLDQIFYLDLCNEFPLPCWAPFISEFCGNNPQRKDDKCREWMKRAIAVVKKSFPDIPVGFSFVAPFDDLNEDMSFVDFIEPHIWMAQSSEYYSLVDYNYERFSDIGYENIAKNGERVYREKKSYFDECLIETIQKVAQWSVNTGKPLITTECWGIVDYKDWPLLNWNWVKDLCEIGVHEASDTGRWIGMATSNFCGPQFHGMWADIAWHRELTDFIHVSRIDDKNDE